jgi:hypothetical protein
MRRRTLRSTSSLAGSGALAVALVLAGCQGTASPSPTSVAVASEPASPSVEPSPSVEASPSVETSASVAPGGSAESSAGASAGSSGEPSFAMPSGFNQAPDLEAQLPGSVGGETLQKFSFAGATALAGSTESNELKAALGALGKSINDVSLAVAAGTGVSIGAYRISGVDSSRLLTVMQGAMAQGSGAFTLSDGTKGGKSVKIGTPSVGGGETIYFYPHGDVLFFVTGSDDAKVTEAISKLP